MKCSAGVAVAAVLVLLSSAITMLGACALMYTYVALLPTTAPANTQLPPGFTPDSLRYFGIGISVFVFALAALGAATGVGLLRLWRWARYSIISFGGFLAAFGALSMIFVLLIPLPVQESNPEIMTGIRIFIAIFYGAWIAVGLWFVLFFTRKKVAAQFCAALAVSTPSLRPISITVLAWFMIVGTVFLPLCIFMHYPAVVFGIVFNGAAAAAVYSCYAVAYLALGIGLLRFNIAAFWGTVGFLCLGALNALVLLLPGPKARYMEFVRGMSPGTRGNPFADSSAFFVFAIGVGVLTVFVPLYFLLTRRKRFFAAAQIAGSPPATPA